jgi:hypothetical protein
MQFGQLKRRAFITLLGSAALGMAARNVDRDILNPPDKSNVVDLAAHR